MFRPTACPDILLIEDNLLQQQQIVRQLAMFGYSACHSCRSAEMALRMVEQNPPALILCNYRMDGEMNGVEFAERVRTRFDIPIVLVTGAFEQEIPRKLLRRKGILVLPKPYLSFQLPMYVEMALKDRIHV